MRARIVKPQSAKQAASGRAWNPWAPGRYQNRPTMPAPPVLTSWWAVPPEQFKAAYATQAGRLRSLRVRTDDLTRVDGLRLSPDGDLPRRPMGDR